MDISLVKTVAKGKCHKLWTTDREGSLLNLSTVAEVQNPKERLCSKRENVVEYC